MKYFYRIWALVNFTFAGVPFLMTLATFFTFVYSSADNQLTADLIFVSLSLFNQIRTPLTLFPLALMDTIKLFVSIRRINEFLNAAELEPRVEEAPVRPGLVLEVEGGSWSWGAVERPVLRDVTLRLEQGELVAVVGLVGAGKSSLLAALLGEMNCLAGAVRTAGTTALAAQQAWIQELRSINLLCQISD